MLPPSPPCQSFAFLASSRSACPVPLARPVPFIRAFVRNTDEFTTRETFLTDMRNDWQSHGKYIFTARGVPSPRLYTPHIRVLACQTSVKGARHNPSAVFYCEHTFLLHSPLPRFPPSPDKRFERFYVTPVRCIRTVSGKKINKTLFCFNAPPRQTRFPSSLLFRPKSRREIISATETNIIVSFE